MIISKEDIVNEIEKMNILEVIQLVKLIEKKFDIQLQTETKSQNCNQVAKDLLNNNIEKKKFFDLYLDNFGENKISVIKEIRVITGLGLKESKQMVDSAPVKVKENITEDQVNTFKDLLEKVGATVTIK